jgi:hypothetical protein
MSRREELKKEGWELASVLSGPRLSEAIQLYEEIGFEVKTFPFDIKEDYTQDEGSGCIECFKGKGQEIVAVYTRKKRVSDA